MQGRATDRQSTSGGVASGGKIDGKTVDKVCSKSAERGVDDSSDGPIGRTATAGDASDNIQSNIIDFAHGENQLTAARLVPLAKVLLQHVSDRAASVFILMFKHHFQFGDHPRIEDLCRFMGVEPHQSPALTPVFDELEYRGLITPFEENAPLDPWTRVGLTKGVDMLSRLIIEVDLPHPGTGLQLESVLDNTFSQEAYVNYSMAHLAPLTLTLFAYVDNVPRLSGRGGDVIHHLVRFNNAWGGWPTVANLCEYYDVPDDDVDDLLREISDIHHLDLVLVGRVSASRKHSPDDIVSLTDGVATIISGILSLHGQSPVSRLFEPNALSLARSGAQTAES